jgi:hypothetical protein
MTAVSSPSSIFTSVLRVQKLRDLIDAELTRLVDMYPTSGLRDRRNVLSLRGSLKSVRLILLAPGLASSQNARVVDVFPARIQTCFVAPIELPALIRSYPGHVQFVDGATKDTESLTGAMFDWLRTGVERAAIQIASSSVKIIPIQHGNCSSHHTEGWMLADYLEFVRNKDNADSVRRF